MNGKRKTYIYCAIKYDGKCNRKSNKDHNNIVGCLTSEENSRA